MTTPEQMKTNLPGRVANLRVFRGRQILQPLMEAVSNALQSIARNKTANGLVRIEIERDQTQRSLDLQKEGKEAKALEEIKLFRIIDNGHGFTDADYDSFLTFDSRHKQAIGGKGVGRLLWLKVFKRVAVDSVYRTASGDLRRRHFRFALPDGVYEYKEEPAEWSITAPSTTVTLAEPYDIHSGELRYRASTIRDEIVRHFLSHLLEDPPAIEVVEGPEAMRVAMDHLPDTQRQAFTIKGHSFQVDHLKVKTPEAREHMIFYCADKREVRREKLKDLPRNRIDDSDGDAFYYQAYVASPVLNDAVNQERTDFILSAETADLADDISLADIRGEVQKHANGFLRPFLEPLQQRKEQRIDTVLSKRVPEYQYVRTHNPDALKDISIEATEQEIEETIATIHFQNQLTGKKQLNAVVEDMVKDVNFDLNAFSDKFDEQFAELNTVNQATLLSFLMFRRTIIDMFAQILRKSGDKHEKEAAIHRLIFPMGKDFEPSTEYLNHNLWMIDERLTYAKYIASDRPISEHKILFDADSRKEPDLAFYFNLGFSADALDGPLHNVVIVEFKRPGPLGSRKEDPYQQVLGYISEIRKGVRDPQGTKAKANDQTRFYCYIVCDLDDKEITKMLETYQFQELFDGTEGYFLYNGKVRAYFEIVPFERVLRDAKRNHKAFFDQAGLLTEGDG